MLLFTGSAARGEAAGGPPAGNDGKMKVRVLILPKFEIGEITGDTPGEAQYYYEHYLAGAGAWDIPGASEGCRLYYRDGVALCLLGMGKVNAALNTTAVLSDGRFDFSEAYILSTGCAGTAEGSSVMGDVFLITAVADYDLGHHADSREMENPEAASWFHDAAYDDMAAVFLNPDLMEKAYALIRDVPVETTERTRRFMGKAFGGAEWALRDPMVLRGTSVTGDNYWKGRYGHQNALRITATYGCPDPYAATEMEDIAVAHAVCRKGMLDRLIILRGSVNMDVFMSGATPESLWGPDAGNAAPETGDDAETADIFETSMRNNFAAGSVLIDAILNGDL